MNIKQNNIDILLGKYISGNASQEDIKELDAWMASSSENQRLVQKNKKLWDNSQNWISHERIEEDKLKLHYETHKQNSFHLNKVKRQLLISKVAAILVIPLTFVFTWYFLSHPKEMKKEYQLCSVIAPIGHISKCILPDGTAVWLNTGSTLTYSISTFNKQLREVNLKGEAYFQVTKNKKKPFHVLASIAKINVTGTSFNVKAYPKSGEFEAVLTEGSIEMQLNNSTHQKVFLVPGERAVFNQKEKDISIESVDPEIFSSWRNGEIIFKDATLNDLITELQRIYNIKFHLKNTELGEYRFRGMFSYNTNLIDALEKIKRTANINYYIENKEVWLSDK